MGVPLLPFHWGFSLLLLAPVVHVEARYYARRLQVDPARARRAAWGANLLTTLLGVPLAWFVVALVQESLRLPNPHPGSAFFEGVTHFAWLDPHEDALFDPDAVLAPALLAFLAPAFLLSIVVEFPILRRSLSVSKGLGRAVVGAHVRSYALLGAIALAGTLWTGTRTTGIDRPAIEGLVDVVAQQLDGLPGVEVEALDHGWILAPSFELRLEGVPEARVDDVQALVLSWLAGRDAGPLVLTLLGPEEMDPWGRLHSPWLSRKRLDPR